MGTLVQFPQGRRVERAGTRIDIGESAVVLVLPVIRIERAPDQSRDRTRAHTLVADLGAAEAQHARHDVGPTEAALLQSGSA